MALIVRFGTCGLHARMTSFPTFPGFDGLLNLSRREGVDIRPTLLRVLTDLYVQAPSHTPDEERQFVALTSRLIDEVDDATRAAVRARLSIYPQTPQAIAEKLHLRPPAPEPELPREEPPAPTASPPGLAMQPEEASELNRMFLVADSGERTQILRNLEIAPLKPATRVEPRRAARAIEAMDRMALEADLIGFTEELARVLILPVRMAEQIVQDEGGEPLACACRAIGMPTAAFEHVLLFLDPEAGASVDRVYRLSRLYDTLPERVALIMLAAWRGTNAAAVRPARYQAMLYDDERQRARMAPAATTEKTPAAAPDAGTRQRGG